MRAIKAILKTLLSLIIFIGLFAGSLLVLFGVFDGAIFAYSLTGLIYFIRKQFK